MELNALAIVQARSGSVRLPRKVLQTLGETSVIGFLLARLNRAKHISRIVVAIPVGSADDELAEHVQQLGFECVRGSQEDVLDRFRQAAVSYFGSLEQCHRTNCVIRITGDCPLVDPELVDQMLGVYHSGSCDYLSNVAPPTFPDGMDVEIFSYQTLESTWVQARDRADREHVTTFIRNSQQFDLANHSHVNDESQRRWTVDESADLQVVREIVSHFDHDKFSWLDVLELQSNDPEMFAASSDFERNAGQHELSGQKLWRRARRVIPGGNSLLSKRAEVFLPDHWPAYFSKAKGCKVWDLDGRELIDMSIMGIGTNILGYGDPTVDAAVSSVVANGNLATLNCPEEVYLAEKLVELHPWSDMARFARTGGEANAMAIRIARAASGRDGVAICGYHGWHDWYLAANLSGDQNLNAHLLPGLAPNGVPAHLTGSAFAFEYNQFEQLDAIVREQSVGVIKMEVMRNMEPENGFLQKVRELASRNNIVLVFDECTSGFRETMGGLHKKYHVEPDMAVFGKTMGNGYAITGVIGRREIMQAAQSTFMSSTFWTERIGPTAALAALEVIEQTNAFETITEIGKTINRRWGELAKQHGLRIKTGGLPSLTSFVFDSPDHLKYKTLLTQEMLKKGYLASTILYACTQHTPDVIDDYFSTLDPVFELISLCEQGRDIDALLDGPVCHSGFKRLN